MTTKFINSRDVDEVSGHLKSSVTNSEDWQEISSLYITGIAELKNLTKERLPSKFLAVLGLSGCRNLISIQPPQTVAYLVLNGCTNLKTLSISSLKNLQILDLEGCENIEWTEELIDFVESLSTGCQIKLPTNYPKYSQYSENAQNIEKVNTRIVSLNNPSTPNLHILFHRYFTEDLAVKERQAILAANVTLPLGIIDQKPEYQIWAEEIAQEFNTKESIDDGDINKNAAEFFQIVTWLEAAKQKDETKKPEALIPIMAYQIITNFVEILLQEQGLEDPFDKHLLTNAFLKRTHDDLCQNGKLNADWLGVPQLLFQQKVSQSAADIFSQFKNILESPIEEKLQKFLTAENLNLAHQKVSEVLEKPMEKNLDDFFANKKNIRIWGRIAFPAEYEKIKNECRDFQTSLKAVNDEGFKNPKLVDLESSFFDEIIKLTKNLIPRSSPSKSPSKQRSASCVFLSSRLKEEEQKPRTSSF